MKQSAAVRKIVIGVVLIFIGAQLMLTRPSSGGFFSGSSGIDQTTWDSGDDGEWWDSSGWDSGISGDSGSDWDWDSGGWDSGGWDSGGGDSGSWDSGGSDSGSW